MQLFEQNVKGIIPQSTFEMMMSKYNKEKKLIEDQIRDLTKIESKQLTEDSNEEKAYILMELLESIDEDNVLATDIVHSMINYISVSSRPMKNYQRKHDYEVVIMFAVLDTIVKEFIKTYEKIGCDIC